MPDYNRSNISETPICLEINRLLEETATRNSETNNHQSLGASAIGSECLRKVQFDWMCDVSHPLRKRDIFQRGYFFESITKKHLIAAGFRFVSSSSDLRFSALDGLLRGHCDGILTGGPDIPGIGYPCVWEHKCLNAKGWRTIERDGLTKEYSRYTAQVLLYQAHLNLTDHPALFTVTNADTLERLHLLLPFNAALAQYWTEQALTVIEATRVGELLPRITNNPEDWRCNKMCSHHEHCWGLP